MEFNIVRKAPLLQAAERNQTRKAFFSELDKLSIMDLLEVKAENLDSLRTFLSTYKKLHPEKKFRSKYAGEIWRIQRLEDN